jgi:hypothetical protein
MTNDSDDEAEAAGRASGHPPPADFRILVRSFVAQAMASLGKMPHPVSGETEVSLPWARYFVDILGELAAKTRGNLAAAEASELEASLSMLRLTYVETAREHADTGGDQITPDPEEKRATE